MSRRALAAAVLRHAGGLLPTSCRGRGAGSIAERTTPRQGGHWIRVIGTCARPTCAWPAVKPVIASKLSDVAQRNKDALWLRSEGRPRSENERSWVFSGVTALEGPTMARQHGGPRRRMHANPRQRDHWIRAIGACAHPTRAWPAVKLAIASKLLDVAQRYEDVLRLQSEGGPRSENERSWVFSGVTVLEGPTMARQRGGPRRRTHANPRQRDHWIREIGTRARPTWVRPAAKLAKATKMSDVPTVSESQVCALRFLRVPPTLGNHIWEEGVRHAEHWLEWVISSR